MATPICPGSNIIRVQTQVGISIVQNPDQKSRKSGCCRKHNNKKSKPAAPDGMNIFQRFRLWVVPCLSSSSKTRSGKATEHPLKPCVCVKKCPDGDIAKMVGELKNMTSKRLSKRYPQAAVELIKLNASHESVTEKVVEVKPNLETQKDKPPVHGPQKRPNANCLCLSLKARKRCKHCKKPI